MAYHDMSQTTLTEDEMLAEKDRILELFGMIGTDGATPKEKTFINQMTDAKTITVKQLFWLRDIRDKLV